MAVGIKKFIMSTLAAIGFTSLKKADGSEMTLEAAVEGMPEDSQYSLDEQVVRDIAVEATKGTAEASKKNADDLTAITAKLEALEKSLPEMTKRIADAEAKNKALQDELAVIKGKPIPDAKKADGSPEDLGDKTPAVDASAYEGHATVKMIRNLVASGAMSEEKGEAQIADFVSKQQKKKK